MSHQFKPGDKVRVGAETKDNPYSDNDLVKEGAIGILVSLHPEGSWRTMFSPNDKLVAKCCDWQWFIDPRRLTLVDDKSPKKRRIQPAATVPDQCTFTQRQRAAIDLRVPDSGTPWLDEMIRQALRQEFAGKALVGVTQGWFDNPGSTSACVEIANDLADALLARVGGAK